MLYTSIIILIQYVVGWGKTKLAGTDWGLFGSLRKLTSSVRNSPTRLTPLFFHPLLLCLRFRWLASSTEVLSSHSPLRYCPYSFTGLHCSARRNALTKMSMPAMSPTMTEGGISAWKKAEGESFSSGDVLLEIVCASLLNFYQRVTTRPCRKPTKRSLMSRHKRMVFSRKLSYVVIL